ncbi:hypothetical protein PA7559_10930 [Pseudoalteromonas distincta]
MARASISCTNWQSSAFTRAKCVFSFINAINSDSVYRGIAAGLSDAKLLVVINKDSEINEKVNTQLRENKRMFTTYKNLLTK